MFKVYHQDFVMKELYKKKKSRVIVVRANDEHVMSLDYLIDHFNILYPGEHFNRSMVIRRLIENEYFAYKYQKFK